MVSCGWWFQHHLQQLSTFFIYLGVLTRRIWTQIPWITGHRRHSSYWVKQRLQQPSARAAVECWPDTPTICGRVFHSSFHELVFLRGSASTHGLIRCWKATFGTAMGGSDQYPFIPKQRTISQELPSTTTQRTRNDTKACLILKLPKNDRYVSKKQYQVVT